MAYKKISSNNQLIDNSAPSLLTDKQSSVNIVDNEFYEIEPAEVLDIILNDQHENFETYEDIGKARVRLMYSQTNSKDKSVIVWAKPLKSNIKDFPLKHEVVLVAYYISREQVEHDDTTTSIPIRPYYSKTINALTSPHHNALLNVSLRDITNAEVTSLQLGNKFKINDKIRPLQQYEGDITYEGRNGQSIRLGHNENITASNIKIRTGQQTDSIPNITVAPINEDINLDASSLYLTENEETDIQLSNQRNKAFKSFPSVFNGSQAIINSNRIILNSKEEQIIATAKNGIHLATGNNQIVIAGEETIIDSDKIYLGNKAKENVVLGKKLESLLGELIDAILAMTHPTSVGPTGTPVNASQFQAIKNKLKNFLSKQNFTL